MTTYYLDTGVLVTPLLKNLPDEVTERCRSWMSLVARGEALAVTSTLTWDEVTWIAGRAGGSFSTERAVNAGELILGLENIRLVPVDEELLHRAQHLLSRFRLRPRDAIHAASAFEHADGRLVTIDRDFASLGSMEGTGALRVEYLGPSTI